MQAPLLIRRKRTRSVTTVETTRERWANLEAHIEFPILRPKANDAPHELVAEEPQTEGILHENGLLKEEVQTLQRELEKLKEACRKQVERKLHTLVEAVDRLKGSPPSEDGEEEERMAYLVCGEIFNQSRYKVIVHSFVTQQPVSSIGN